MRVSFFITLPNSKQLYKKYKHDSKYLLGFIYNDDVGANEGNIVAARLLKCTSGDYVHMNTSIH